MLPEVLKTILDNHKKWLNNDGGERADLRYADLRIADLSNAYLRNANLRSADLRCADLSNADLRCADLSYADLRCANLSCANLRIADLRYADLNNANLRYAYLNSASHSLCILKSVNGMEWDILIKDDMVKVGCQEHTYEQWVNFTSDEITEMDSKASDFYPILMTLLASQYRDTKFAIIKE